MKQTTKEDIIRRTRTLMRRTSLAAMVAAIIGFALPVMAAPALPREPMPRPHLPNASPGIPKPSVHIGTRPRFNPSNIGALPDLKIVRVIPRINSHVAGICRAGRKDRPGSSIPVLNFDVVVKNVGRGTAYMDRYGVILSAQTTDFHERVFDTNKRYQGGTGGPGHFQGPHGPQPWLLVSMGQIAPGATFMAHAGLGIGRNNTRFTIARMHELAGQTHRFRIKLTSYGTPGLKESNTRNNEYIVNYTFPHNFCQPAAGIHVRPVGVPVPTLPSLPDLTIVRVTPRLIPQAASACQSGGSYRGGLIHLKTVIKNVGRGNADYRRYQYGIRITTTDPLSSRTPRFFIRKIYATGSRSGAPGQSVINQDDLDAIGIYSGSFPPSRYHELAGTTRHFKVEIIDGPGAYPHPMLESNYRNNAKTFSFTFPRNFCQQSVVRGGVTQPVATLPDFLITKLTPPNTFACSARGGHIAMGFFRGKMRIKNRGGDPTYAAAEATTLSNFTLARLTRVPGTRLRFRLTGGIKYRNMPKAGQTIHSSFAVGLWNDSKTNGQASAADLSKAMQWLRGRTVSLPIQINGPRRADLTGKPMLEGNTRNNTSTLRLTFPRRLCRNLTTTTQSGSTPVHLHPAGNSPRSGSNGRQNGGRGINVQTGLPDLEISEIHLDKAACFQPSGNRFYKIPLINGSVTVTNRGTMPYISYDDIRNKSISFNVFLQQRNVIDLPNGGHGSKYYLHPSLIGGSGPYGPQGYWYNVKIAPGKSIVFPIQILLRRYPGSHRLARGNDRETLSKRDARSLLGKQASLFFSIGHRNVKKRQLDTSVPRESNYQNNTRGFRITFPGNECVSRL